MYLGLLTVLAVLCGLWDLSFPKETPQRVNEQGPQQ